MIIESKDGKKEDFEHFKGGEGKMTANMFFDGTNRIVYGLLKPGNTIGFHSHEGNCEIIHILSGKAKFLYDDIVEYGKAGQTHYCPQGHSHAMINASDEDLVFFAVVPKQ